MKVCITEHECPGFGTIPAGSLWADDSPYTAATDMFDDVAAPVAVAPKPMKSTPRKFGTKEQPL